MHETGFQQGISSPSDWGACPRSAVGPSPVWGTATEELWGEEVTDQQMFGKSLLQSFWKLFYSSSDQGDFLRSCISFGRCASIKRSLFYHLACTIAWVALSKNLGPSAFLPAMQEKKQRFPRREVLNRLGMRNFLGRTLSHQCMRGKSQQTGAGEAGPCRASDTGELCEPSDMGPTPGSTQETWGVQRWDGDSRGSIEIGQKWDNEPESYPLVVVRVASWVKQETSMDVRSSI